MLKHTKIYLEYFGYPDYISCEVCGDNSVDIHHLCPRSSYGKKKKHLQDTIENLIALCRVCHNKAHSNELKKEYLCEIHQKYLVKI